MADEIREELLSAYLDGELSVEERARAEQWLAESAEARQLLDELRSVRSGMKSLARHKVGEDFGVVVLKHAERAQSGGVRQEPDPEKITPGGLAREWWSRGGVRRFAWPAVALAAALLIALFNTEEQPPERQVAQTHAPQGETFIGARDKAEPAPDDARSKDKNLARSAEKASVDSKAGVAANELADSQKPKSVQRQMKEEGAASPTRGANSYAAPAGNQGGMAKKALPSEAEADEETVTVVCDVTPAFTRDRGFEKLLNQQNINFRRGDQRNLKQAEVADRLEKESLAEEKPEEEPYEVDATPEQVDQIITLLRQDSSRVGRIAKDQPAAQSAATEQRQRNQNAAPRAQNQAQSAANQRARAQFQFHVIDSLPPQKARN